MPMKVTVCFDRVRIIVPCGDGEILVRQLIEKAVVRYKKATGKSSDHWVSVHNLRTINDGGILDPDDQLLDVVDDREQLIADYEEQGSQTYQPHNGDGASQSSAGTTSPDIFQGSEVTAHLHDNKNFSAYRQDDEHDVIVTSRDLEGVGPGLTVRRGSEPVLNILPGDDDSKISLKENHQLHDQSDSEDHEVAKEMDGGGDRTKGSFSRFSRDSWRQSLGNRPDMYKWLEAQERQHDKIQQMERTEPVGGASIEHTSTKPQHPPEPRPMQGSILINLPNDGGPLGIHVVPDYSENGREMGLLVQGVEDGGRVAKDGRLRENDRIIEINSQTLVDVSFSRAQDIFRSAMKRDEIKLRIIKKQVPPLPKQPPPPVMPKPRGHIPLKPSPLTLPLHGLVHSDSLSPTGPDGTSTPAQNSSSSSLEGTVVKSPILPNKPAPPAVPPSPSKRVPPVVPMRHPTTSLTTDKGENSGTTTGQQKLVAPTNTKKIGKKIDIVLTKGPVGLGFSVTTRDNPAGGDSPIYIKNILPRGAAITDGRLRAGDRLLEVNGEDLSGKTQSDVVGMLRNMSMGSMVKLVISRQEAVDTRFQVPRAMPAEKSGDDGTLANMKNKDIISLDIPLNDSGSAGLGVSVKGKTLTTDQVTKDLGIFVKSVIHGGAASKDGRLVINDQLIEVNGEVLPGLSNTDAMETLRKAMQTDGPIPGYIHLVIARKIGAPSPSPFQQGETTGDQFTFSANGDSKFLNDSDGKELFLGAEHLSASYNSKNSSNNRDEGEKSEPAPPPRGQLHKHFEDTDGGKARMFLIDRLTGDSGALRNESYTRATHESFNDSGLSSRGEDPGGNMRNTSYNLALASAGNLLSPGISPFKPTNQSSPTVKPLPGNSVLIQNDEEIHRPVRPHSTIGFLHRSLSHSNSSSSEDLNHHPVWLQDIDWGQRQSVTSAELSPISPEPMGDFRREGFGRQSMSEKRKGHIDPSKSEFYQRVKSQREKGKHEAGTSASFSYPQPGKNHGGSNLVRAGSAESIVSRNSKGYTRLPPLPRHGKRITDVKPVSQPPPQSNLKRFGSLENLAQDSQSPDTSNHSLEISNESLEQDDGQMSRPVRLGRGRGCNDSFRAAVDRSYDPAPMAELTTMETREQSDSVVEGDKTITMETVTLDTSVEEESSESGSLGQSGFQNNSMRSSASSENATEDGNKKKSQKKNKEKKPSIFKGLMKFGKSKKSQEESSGSKKAGADNSSKQEDEEEERIQEEMRQLQEKHEEAEKLRQQSHGYPMGNPSPSGYQTAFTPLPPRPHLNEQHSAPQLHPRPQGPYLGGHQGPYTRGPHDGYGRLHGNQWSGGDRYNEAPEGQHWMSQLNRQQNPNVDKTAVMSRAEWIQQLRSEHQRRHRERQGQYPRDAQEEQYERQIQHEEEMVGDYIPPQEPHRYGKSAIPENVLHGPMGRSENMVPSQPPRPHSTNPSSYDRSYDPPSLRDLPQHNYPHFGHIVHPRQHSNEIIPSRQSRMDHFHQRQNSDISEHYSQDFYARRPPSRGRTPVNHWTSQDNDDVHTDKHRRSPYVMGEPPPGGGGMGGYREGGYAYREPVYPAMAGRRPVHTYYTTRVS
ncbi:hypothetical protein FSP39_015692 [Pinctada imbricata]|uniref:PDZ domain-containing protein n=1 Tax=Pinctada imbricata TaxID=66713 RepID=A0AA88YP02_PINIB|nr:hypothetical protein FSP39_015692 [Pinctada imbricata]